MDSRIHLRIKTRVNTGLNFVGKKAAQRRIKRVSEDEEDHVIVPFEKKKDEICINQFPEELE